MPFNYRKTFIHLQNTNEDIFVEIRWPPLAPMSFPLSRPIKGTKDVVKNAISLQWFNINIIKQREDFWCVKKKDMYRFQDTAS